MTDTAEESASELRTLLEGRTITAAIAIIRKPPLGIGGQPAIEGLTLHLDNNTRVELQACGWHDIQELTWDVV